ncbi:hypothetical protein E2C01_099463 [Portunus trituberculatus]|uniref:Uncharacterized protein n=1 Tax=Portunus trituberculatus TaxID=210409 RepID=A0A5B7KFG2_PORTR|nr:hypothetical protein [Portunus trituberculatus]
MRCLTVDDIMCFISSLIWTRTPSPGRHCKRRVFYQCAT